MQPEYGNIVWKDCQFPTHRVYVICQDDKNDNDKVTPVVIAADENTQEWYIPECGGTPESVLSVFMNYDAAEQYIRILRSVSSDEFKIRRVKFSAMEKFMKVVDDKYKRTHGGPLRIDAYDCGKDGVWRREIVFSGQIPKH